MKSLLLERAGLYNQVIGLPYNFRTLAIGPEAMAEQLARLIEAEQLGDKQLYLAQQTHSARVVDVHQTAGDPFVMGTIYPDTDGLITNQTRDVLLIKYADCTPIVIYDPVQRVQASVHSGWRGTVQRIAQEAVDQLVRDYRSKPADLLAFVGPTISQMDYQVGREVYEAFDGMAGRDQFFAQDGDRYRLDLSRLNRELLIQAGLRPEHIECSSTSTYQDERLHSARREGADYGLNGIITYLK